MAISEREEALRASSPLYNANRVKLAIFGLNCDYGCTISTAEGRWELNWPDTARVAQLADAAGIEALVPIARWRGFGGVTDFNASNYETYTWAAGVAASTRHLMAFCTSHVPTIHPIVAAKQATTVDHVSNGRFGLNVVCGWARPELEMFGAPVMDHETAYDYAAEWVQILRKLWTEQDEFDYDGQFFHIKRGFHQPKPIQRPGPPIMQAGSSPTGRRFAARFADMAFINARRSAFEEYRDDIANLRRMAHEEFGRTLQVWGHGYVVCRPTEREAQEYLHYYVVEKGDWEAADNLGRTMRVHERVTPEQFETFKYHFIAGWGGFPLVGTPEQIVDGLQTLAGAGFDGIMLSWVNVEAELRQWIGEVLPLMEQAGLRQPFHPHD